VYITSMSHAKELGQVEYDQAACRYLLVSEDFGGAQEGGVSVLVVPPDTDHIVRAGSCDTGSVLVSGDGDRAVGTVFRGHPGDHFTLHTGTRGATLLTVEGRPPARFSDSARSFSLDQVPDNPAHNPALGFHHMQAKILIDTAVPAAAEIGSGGRSSFSLGMGIFAPGEGRHALHRHAHAEEIFYVWEGAGVHLTGDGVGHPLSAGQLAFVPRNEWHGFHNTGSTPVRAFFGYLGVGSRADAGYEVMDTSTAATDYGVIAR
jgi:quercetin dioxygenase-like cupin family protein